MLVFCCYLKGTTLNIKEQDLMAPEQHLGNSARLYINRAGPLRSSLLADLLQTKETTLTKTSQLVTKC